MTTTHSLINQLIQLQELVVANMQKKVSMPNARLEELGKSIELLSADLPQQVRSHFNRLVQKHPEAIVPVANELCTGCGMGLTKSMVQSVHKAEDLNRCPNCARFLYYPEQLISRERVSRSYGAVRKKGVSRFTSPELMMVSLKGTTPEEVLGEICSRMAEENFVDDGAHLLDLALQREAIISTAVDNSLAFPHVRGVEGGGLSMAVGIHKKGVKFGGPGRTLTRIFFFVVIPTATSAFYLKLISGLSRTFREKGASEALLAAATEEELWKALIKATKKTFK
ncbi:PTS sugar transporter subunit IIA [Pontiella sulfatireligans]|uniref:PTS system mannose-specific EIIBCA component n=1 Tax=Pontiella sulfatireligans TaxID=2750658 RepID=A0A6C2UIR6_9BACT|nr:PTS sugar transporter subunit IIA [Pontiella sulfatireligans]VGO20112.1 PTS system mannose-specific EIIBCA component [Pontiella sulfatireligans]